MNPFHPYSNLDRYIKNSEKMLKIITPFLDNPILKDAYEIDKKLNAVTPLPFSHKTPYFDIVKSPKISESMSSLLSSQAHLKTNLIDIASIASQMKTILNATKQDPLNGILSDINTSKTIIPEILSNLDVSAVNDYMQDVYDNTDEITDTDFEESALNLLENFQTGVEKYNSNPDTPIKVQVPFCETNTGKNLKYFLELLAAIVTILSLSGYNIRQEFIEPLITQIETITDIEESKQ